MKRIFVFVFTLSLTVMVFSQSKVFSRWSLTPEFGYNYFDGDINQNLSSIFPTSFRNVTYGATVEYALTPIWGLALDGYYFPLRAQNSNPAPIYINTDLYNSDFSATINFTRWIFPNSKSKFYVNGSIGLGFAYYKYDVRYLDNVPVGDLDAINGKLIKIQSNGAPMKYGMAGSCPVTMSVEYNFSKPISIGIKAHYRAYTKDNLEGVAHLNWDGVTNDFIAAGTIFLRYKLGAISKDHLRNIQFETYEPDKGLLLAKELEAKLNKLAGKVDTIGRKVDSLMPRVARLENLLSTDGPDADGDGVPDVRDKESNTPANTPVDFWGKTLPISTYSAGNPYAPVTNAAGITNTNSTEPGTSIVGSKPGTNHKAICIPDDVPAVYFDFDQIELDDVSLIAISKVAAKMKNDPTLFVEVRGYCDYSGNNPYNNLLSQRRSDRVKAEMVKVWGIPFDHIISNGKGKVIEPRIRYKPNRRCDFFYGRL